MTDKEEIISFAMDELNSRASETITAGDRKYGKIGAKKIKWMQSAYCKDMEAVKKLKKQNRHIIFFSEGPDKILIAAFQFIMECNPFNCICCCT